MKGNKLIIMGMGFILMAAAFAPLAMGENDSLHVILTVEDRNYSVGDTINIQMRIYNLGTLTNVASTGDIYFGMSTHYSFSNPANLTLTSQSTGVYAATYTIKAADNNQDLYFFYEVTLGNDHEETASHNDALVIPVYSIQDTVDVSFDGQAMVPAKPGDVLKATILTRTGATPIPVTGFTQLYVEAPGGLRQNLTYTTLQTGIYNVEFTVPQTSISGTYEILAQPMGMGDQDTATVVVNVLDVWHHKLSVTGNTVSFEVCVADLLGVPMEGANFVIQRTAWPNDQFFGITNASGKAIVHVPDVEGADHFTGYVLAAGLNQTISGAVFNMVPGNPPEPQQNGFDIIWEGTETVFEPGADITIPYGAYNDRIPAASKSIYYYVTASGTDFINLNSDNHVDGAREVLAAGTATTDTLGKFSIAFRLPDTQCSIQVTMEAPIDRAGFTSQDYDLDDDMYYAVWPPNTWDTEGFIFLSYEGNLDGDSEVGIGGGSFKPGKAGKVSVELSAGSGDPVMAYWTIGEGSFVGTAWDPQWMSWVPAGNNLRLEQTESGKYEATFLVPEFIEGQDVTITSGYINSADGVPHFDSKTISPGGSLPWLWIIVIVIAIVLVLVLVIVIKSRF